MIIKIYCDEIILLGSSLKTHNDAASSVIPLTKNFIFWAVVKITIHQIHPLVNRQYDVSCWLVIVILVCPFFGLAGLPQLSWLNVNILSLGPVLLINVFHPTRKIIWNKISDKLKVPFFSLSGVWFIKVSFSALTKGMFAHIKEPQQGVHLIVGENLCEKLQIPWEFCCLKFCSRG